VPKKTGRRLRTWKAWLAIWAPLFVLVGVGFVVAWMFVEPAPPDKVVIAAGAKGGAYYRFAERYRPTFSENGVDLLIRATEGSVDNYQLLMIGEAGVDLALVQSGIAPRELLDGSDPPLRAIAAVDYEPVWVFYRTDFAHGRPLRHLRDLRGGRVAVGGQGSGTRHLAVELFHATGHVLPPDDTPETDGGADRPAAAPAPAPAAPPVTTLVDLSGDAAFEALAAGRVDAMMAVSAPDNPLISRIAHTPGIALMDLAQAEGLARQMPHLSAVTLPAGAIDPAARLPAADVRLVAPRAILIMRADAHGAIAQLGARAAERVHSDGSRVAPPGEFPSLLRTEWPMSKEARYYLENGPNLLQRYLPFWAASLLTRTSILLLPLLGLLLPLFRIAPPLYRWRIRARVFKWYRQLRHIDEAMLDKTDRQTMAGLSAELDAMERELADVQVPLAYMEEFYNLRLHLGYLRVLVRRANEAAMPWTPGAEAGGARDAPADTSADASGDAPPV